MLNAKQAREIADKVFGPGNEAIAVAERHIRNAAEQGRRNVIIAASILNVPHHIRERFIGRMSELGYRVKCWLDQRDGDYWEIGW